VLNYGAALEDVKLSRAGGGFLRTLRQTDQLMRDLPQRVDDLWGQLEEGEVTIGIDLRLLESLTSKLDVVVNRLAFRIVVAALIISSSLIILGAVAPKTWHFPGFRLPIAEISLISLTKFLLLIGQISPPFIRIKHI